MGIGDEDSILEHIYEKQIFLNAALYYKKLIEFRLSATLKYAFLYNFIKFKMIIIKIRTHYFFYYI